MQRETVVFNGSSSTDILTPNGNQIGAISSGRDSYSTGKCGKLSGGHSGRL